MKTLIPLACCVCAATAQAQGILSNAGFELLSDDQSIAMWTQSGTVDSTDGVVRNGERAVTMTASAGSDAHLIQQIDLGAISPPLSEHNFRFGIFARIPTQDNPPEHEAWLQFRGYEDGTPGSVIFRVNFADNYWVAPDSDGWTHVTIGGGFPTELSDLSAEILIHVAEGAEGSVSYTFDDAGLRSVPAPSSALLALSTLALRRRR